MNINVNIELLKTFYVVAKNKNITKASEELLISQSTVSKSLKNLENQLDCQLFTRSKKGVELTKEGEILYESTEKIIDILNTNLKKITKTNTINILVGKVLAEKVLCPYLNTFKKKYPNIRIKLSSTNIDGVINMLKDNEADIAIGYYIEDLNDSYEQVKITKELHPIFVCNKSFKDLLNRKIGLKELENIPYIISAKGATTHKYALDFFKANNLDITPSMEILGTSLITQFVKNGLGISILTEEFIKDDLNNKELYKIKLNKKLETRELYLLTYKNRTKSKEIKYLIDLLTNNNL